MCKFVVYPGHGTVQGAAPPPPLKKTQLLEEVWKPSAGEELQKTNRCASAVGSISPPVVCQSEIKNRHICGSRRVAHSWFGLEAVLVPRQAILDRLE